MKKIIISFIFVLSACLIYTQDNKHNVYLNTFYNLSIENTLYINFDNPDYSIWSEPGNKVFLGLGYTYNLNEYLGIGIQAEYEKIELEDYLFGDVSAKRSSSGVHFQAKYPTSNFHALGGGYFNFSLLNSDDFDNNLTGIEYGLFFGPEYSFSDFNLALMFVPRFGYYFSGQDAPDDALLMNPRLTFRIGYSF